MGSILFHLSDSVEIRFAGNAAIPLSPAHLKAFSFTHHPRSFTLESDIFVDPNVFDLLWHRSQTFTSPTRPSVTLRACWFSAATLSVAVYVCTSEKHLGLWSIPIIH
jgi:hypothetical protein